MEVAAYTIDQLDTYDKWKVDILTERSIMNEAEAKGLAKGEARGLKIGEARGEAKGLKRGEEIGLAKGEEIGLAKGEAERTKLLERIAKLEQQLSTTTK